MPDTRIEAVIRRARYNKATSVISWRDRSDEGEVLVTVTATCIGERIEQTCRKGAMNGNGTD